MCFERLDDSANALENLASEGNKKRYEYLDSLFTMRTLEGPVAVVRALVYRERARDGERFPATREVTYEGF